MFKIAYRIALDKFAGIFETRNKMNYNLGLFSNVSGPLADSVYNVTKTISFLGPKGISYPKK